MKMPTIEDILKVAGICLFIVPFVVLTRMLLLEMDAEERAKEVVTTKKQ